MQHFFVVPDQVRDGYIEITGSDVNHMKNVLRMKTGEQLEISDGNNKKYLCEIESLEADKVTARILEEREAENELPSKLYLFQGLPKSDKMELIIQKAVELGAWEVIPVATKRAVVKLDQKKTPKSSIGKISFCPFPITSSIIRFVICGDSMSRLTLITRQPIANAYTYHFSNRYFDIFFISFPVLLSSLIQQTFFAPKNLFLFQSATLLCSARNLLKILIKR